MLLVRRMSSGVKTRNASETVTDVTTMTTAMMVQMRRTVVSAGEYTLGQTKNILVSHHQAMRDMTGACFFFVFVFAE